MRKFQNSGTNIETILTATGQGVSPAQYSIIPKQLHTIKKYQ